MAEKKVVKRKGNKNVRKAKRRRIRNVKAKSILKTALKAARAAIASGAAGAIDAVKKAVSLIDKAAERKIIHPNKAARLKSRLQRAR